MDRLSCFWITTCPIFSCICAVKYVGIQPFTHWKHCFTVCWKKIQSVTENTAEGASLLSPPFYFQYVFSTKQTSYFMVDRHTHTISTVGLKNCYVLMESNYEKLMRVIICRTVFFLSRLFE